MSDSTLTHLALLAGGDALRRLAGLGFEWSPVDQSAAAAAAFKRSVPGAMPIAALVGGASSGKSTLFNSLLDREVSRISAHAHETIGPIAAVHERAAPSIDQWHRQGWLLPNLKLATADGRACVVGALDTLTLYRHQAETLAGGLLIDLPDVTSKMSSDEGALARSLLGWFDTIIFVVDEERWFDAAVFEREMAFARNFGPRCWVVFNRTEQPDELTPVQVETLQRQASLHQAAGCCVSPFQPGSGYRPVSADTKAALVGWLAQPAPADRLAKLEQHLRRRCGDIVRENVARTDHYQRLCSQVDRELARVCDETSLTTDLLTTQERELLGLSRRFIPLYDVLTQVRRKLSFLKSDKNGVGVDFEKRAEVLAEVLRRNLEHRFTHATSRIDQQIADSPYTRPSSAEWAPSWSVPELDANQWARRIRGHIDAWKAETRRQSHRGDLAALALGSPLLLADLLFLGGAGLTLTWATAWVVGFFGGKSLMSMVQKSPAFAEYQTTVRAYQAFLRDSLTEQWEANRAAMPLRHLRGTDPLMQALLGCSTPGRKV